MIYVSLYKNYVNIKSVCFSAGGFLLGGVPWPALDSFLYLKATVYQTTRLFFTYIVFTPNYRKM